jgi:hypothetical protein
MRGSIVVILPLKTNNKEKNNKEKKLDTKIHCTRSGLVYFSVCQG